MGFLDFLHDKHIYFVGIKGTGMSSLASMLAQGGIHVLGSDSSQIFYTDALLSSQHIHIDDWSTLQIVPDSVDMLIYSAACKLETHAQIADAVGKGIPIYSYPEFLSLLTQHTTCYGVAGTHGKTTSTALVSTMLANTGIGYYAVYGASSQQGHTKYFFGDTIGVIEACEYKDHYLNYILKGALLTTIDYDHPDYFKSEQDVETSFWEFAARIPDGGFLIVCIDTESTLTLARRLAVERPLVHLITYGYSASAMFRCYNYRYESNESFFSLSFLDGEFSSPLVGPTLVLNTVGAALMAACIVLFDSQPVDVNMLYSDVVVPAMLREGQRFEGCTLRSEIVGVYDRITFIKDYAHHPTEIETTLSSLRMKFPESRIIVVFASHTVSRTKAFFDAFSEALSQSDMLFIRDIAQSAREDGDVTVCSALAQALAEQSKGMYISDEDALLDELRVQLHPGDVCVTMGAGNNNALMQRLVDSYRRKAE